MYLNKRFAKKLKTSLIGKIEKILRSFQHNLAGNESSYRKVIS